MVHGLLEKVNFYFTFSEKLIFRGKMPLKCSKKCSHNVQKPNDYPPPIPLPHPCGNFGLYLSA